MDPTMFLLIKFEQDRKQARLSNNQENLCVRFRLIAANV